MEKLQSMQAKKQANPKQLVAVAVLTLLLIGVGVWQWTNLSQPAPQNTPSKPAQATSNSSVTQTAQAPAQPATGIVLPALSPRDPFKPTPEVVAQAATQNNNKVVVAKKSEGAPKREIGGVPPVALPAPGNLQLELAKTEPEDSQAPQTPQWTVVGVVQGPNTLAILKDGEGNRRFVRPGDTLEEGWRVQQIQRGQVVFKKANEQISVRVGQSTQEHGGSQ
ncbi:MAG: DNA utilization family protein [Fimbriimonadales bacterium]|jgi:cytoskeletal protein RodZ|nr:DNA utilization family protein [Fimbriimonadales bacterium]GBC90357.1 hypothetical protein HRbin14_01092 [bacterium HR14]GIV13508.1 MAG: hypothetical protein KatS3mg021_1790 [Fimbriimonadales bacterium]CUU05655.1 Protein of unknown function (DUF2531) [Armatimonadetes bacterium GBS]CUU36215.1 Protein of unknown function (DUF2531) [Armatimonadetes bacterium GXS]